MFWCCILLTSFSFDIGPYHIIDVVYLYIHFAQLVLEELAAGRHHHFVHIDVVVLGVGKKIKNIEIF